MGCYVYSKLFKKIQIIFAAEKQKLLVVSAVVDMIDVISNEVHGTEVVARLGVVPRLKIGIYFLAITFNAACTMSGVSMWYFFISSSGLPLSPNESFTATNSIGAGYFLAST